MKVGGIGKAKAERYGGDILKLTSCLKSKEKTDEQLEQKSYSDALWSNPNSFLAFLLIYFLYLKLWFLGKKKACYL